MRSGDLVMGRCGDRMFAVAIWRLRRHLSSDLLIR
jgi:hypothetical protein